MLLSIWCQVPLGLLLTCLSNASPAPHHARPHRRQTAPAENVLGGQNFPDPSIINYNGVSYVFGTTTAGLNIPYTSNSNFGNSAGWDQTLIDSFPTDDVPAFGSSGWAAPGTSWAPDVNQLTDFDGSFALYYAPALQSNTNIHCIGLARSLTVTGPYNDSSTEPFICPEDAGGAIDPNGFLDTDNSRYVVYKIDGPTINNGGYCNNPNNPPSTNTSLMLQQVQNDGYTTIGGPVVLYNNAGVSDSYNVEAPVLVNNGGTYFLFFSSGCTSANSYTINYVTSTSVWGPYGDRQVLLQTGDEGTYGPGSCDYDPASGDFVYASLLESGDINSGRGLDTASVSLSGQSASVGS